MEKGEKKRVGTPKTEQVIGTGVSKLEQAIKGLEAAFNKFNGLQSMLNDYTTKITDAEQKMVELKNQFETQKKQNTVDLELLLRAEEATALEGILNKHNKVAVNREEFSTLQTKAVTNEEERKKEVEKNVATATNSLKSKYEADRALLEATFKTQEADNKAKITQLELMVKNFEMQSSEWKRQLEEERKASVERAKASSVGAINVSSQK